MAAAPEKMAALRHLLAGRFPAAAPATTGAFAGRSARAWPTGLAALDEIAGGLPAGALTEIVCAAPSCGGHLLLQHLLGVARRALRRVALIDSSDDFDPGSCTTDLLAHLVWVRCRGAAEALQAADLLARDANLGLVLLDLRSAPEADLRRIPGPQWYRLQRAAESADLALVVETPRASVPSAQVRLSLETPHPLAALDAVRAELAAALAPALQRRRFHAAAG